MICKKAFEIVYRDRLLNTNVKLKDFKITEIIYIK